MRIETIATTVNLLSTIFGSEYQELVLISQLNDAFNFDHNIFLMHSSADIGHFVSSTDQVNYTPRCLFIFDEGSTAALEIFEHRTGKKELLIVVPTSSNFDSNLTLLSFVKKIQLLNVNLKIGIFFSHFVTSDDLQKLFEWCWNHRIINIFTAFGGVDSESLLNVFIFNPLGTFDVINVTGSEWFHRVFPEKILNFRQHSFRVAVIADESIVQYSSSVEFIDGPDELLWKAVFSVINATYSIFLVTGSLDGIEVLDNGTVDIHGDLTDIMEQGIVTVYPTILEIVSIVVPRTKPYSTFEAYVQIMTSSDFLGYTSIMIGVVVFVLISSRYINCKKIVFSQCIADVMNVLLNENSAIKYQRLSFSEVFLFVPMTFAGFIIVNGFLSSLKSNLTRPVLQPQIETVEDFYRSPIPMTSPNDYWLAKDAENLNSLLKYGNFSFKMRTIDYADFVQQIITEVPFSFAEYNSIAKFMCKHKKYYITPIQIQRIWYSHRLRNDFPFIDRFNDIIQRITTAGLYDKWWKDATIEDKLFRSVAAETHTDRFTTPEFVVYGWIAGFIVLIIEVNWKKIKKKFLLFLRIKK